MKFYTTCYSDGNKQSALKEIFPDVNEKEREKELVNLYPQVRYQTIAGFGGAFTDSAGYMFAQMPPHLQDRLIDDYFSPEGLGYTIGRTSVDSCDFSLECYASCDTPGDMQLDGFDVSRAQKYMLPLLRRANQKAAQPIKMMLTPWTPPAWMKTNGSRLRGGMLKEEYYGLWAEYICRFIKQYQADGVDVCAVSSQNEPKAVQTWDSCLLSGTQERIFIRDHLYPALCRHGLDQLKVLIWDHNKERAFDRACETINDEVMDSIVDGVAVHWYSGDHFEALQMIRERYPDKLLVFSEACVEYSIYAEPDHLRNAQMYAHDIIGNLNHGLNAFIDWNLVLNEQGGPNHVGNYCDAPMMYDTRTGVLTKNLSYDYIGHFSRYIKPGAVRIGMSRFDTGLEVVAAQNPDGSIAVVTLNRQPKDVSFFLRLGDKVWPVQQPAQSISTCVITAQELA